MSEQRSQRCDHKIGQFFARAELSCVFPQVSDMVVQSVICFVNHEVLQCFKLTPSTRQRQLTWIQSSRVGTCVSKYQKRSRPT